MTRLAFSWKALKLTRPRGSGIDPWYRLATNFGASSYPGRRARQLIAQALGSARSDNPQEAVAQRMPTIVTHAFVGTALGQLGPSTVPRWRLAFALAVLSVLPDLDVVTFHFHIPYFHWLGHRGFSHSFLFALIVAAVVAQVEFRHLRLSSAHWWWVFALCAFALVSHGLLDGLTDGGLGIAFFLPFDSTRYFLPIRPLHVSPIGLTNFLEGPALSVLRSEFIYVWLPVAVAAALAKVTLQRWRAANKMG